MRSRLRTLRNDEQGAALILALIVITVVALVTAAVLSFSDTSVRNTVALRDQAATSYAADGAAQTAVSALQKGTLDCTSATSLPLGKSGTPFYMPAKSSTESLNAYVSCSPTDPTTTTITTGSGVTIDENNTLGYGLLTVGSTTGQAFRGNTPTCIAGGSVVSNMSILLAGQGTLNSLKAGKPTSRTLCALQADPTIAVTTALAIGCNGVPTDNDPSHFTPTPCTHASAVPSSTWTTLAPKPTSGYTVTNPAPLCYTGGTTTYAAFRPGRYTQVPGTGSSCSTATFQWFTPGVYYFQYSGQWSWPATLVGGTPQDSNGDVIASLVGLDVTNAANASKLAALSAVTKFPGSCADPAVQSTYDGVEFVFGGSSTIQPSSAGSNELCATYSATDIPVAIYGVSRDVVGGNALSLTGGGTISAQTLCTSAPCTSASIGGAPLISSDSNGGNSIYVQGYLYAPSAPVTMTFKNNPGLLLGWGVVVRSFDFTENGTSPTAPFVAYRPALHQGATTTTVTSYPTRYLEVWTCSATTASCAPSGDPDLTVKVQTDGWKVLSWSNHR